MSVRILPTEPAARAGMMLRKSEKWLKPQDNLRSLVRAINK
jgi:hypothetical protein